MPFNKDTVRSPRETIVFEKGIEYFRVTEYKDKKMFRYEFKKYKDAIKKLKAIRNGGNTKTLIYACWQDFCTSIVDRSYYKNV